MEAVLGMLWTQGATSRKIGWWCAAHFLKPLPYFRTKSVIFPTLFQTWSKMWYPISDLLKNQFPRSDQCWRQCLYAFLSRVQNCTKLYCYGTYMVGVNIRREMVLSPNDEEVASSKNIPNSRPECTNHTLLHTKMIQIDTLFQTKMAKKSYPLAPHIPI